MPCAGTGKDEEEQKERNVCVTRTGSGLWELGEREAHRETGRMGGRLETGENRCAHMYMLPNHSLVVPRS